MLAHAGQVLLLVKQVGTDQIARLLRPWFPHNCPYGE